MHDSFVSEGCSHLHRTEQTVFHSVVTDMAQRKRTPSKSTRVAYRKLTPTRMTPRGFANLATLWHSFACLHRKWQQGCHLSGRTIGQVFTCTLTHANFSPTRLGRINTTPLFGFFCPVDLAPCRADLHKDITFARPGSSSWHQWSSAKPRRTGSKAESRTKFFHPTAHFLVPTFHRSLSRLGLSNVNRTGTAGYT